MLRRPVELGQYLAIRYTERLADAVAASVGSRGDSYDNALAESFNGLMIPPAEFEAIHYHQGIPALLAVSQ